MLPEVPVVQHPGGDERLVVLVAFVAEIAGGEGTHARLAVDQADLTTAVPTLALEILPDEGRAER